MSGRARRLRKSYRVLEHRFTLSALLSIVFTACRMYRSRQANMLNPTRLSLFTLALSLAACGPEAPAETTLVDTTSADSTSGESASNTSESASASSADTVVGTTTGTPPETTFGTTGEGTTDVTTGQVDPSTSTSGEETTEAAAETGSTTGTSTDDSSTGGESTTEDGPTTGGVFTTGDENTGTVLCGQPCTEDTECVGTLVCRLVHNEFVCQTPCVGICNPDPECA